jgi:hypothetical protein
MFPAVQPLNSVVAEARDAGWHVEHLDTATQSEWDGFESRWRKGHDPHVAAERLREYQDVYRGQLGFCYLVLRR